MALQTKVYTQTSNTFTLELTLTENSTSVSGNSSSVSYTLKLKSTTKDFYQYRVGASVSLDGKTVATRDRYTASQIGIGTYSSVTLLSGTATVGHGADGTKTMALSYALDMASASYTPGPVSGSGTMALTHIPRGATITSAPNFTDEDSPTVKYSNPAGGSLQVGIYKTDGSTALAGYRTATGSSYTFHFTAAEKANLQKVNTGGNTATVRFCLKSVVGGQTFLKSVDRTLTIANPAPTLNPTVTDSNDVTYALTGDRSKLVKYHSNAKVTFGAAAVKGATLKSKKVTCATQALTADGTMQGVESGTFSFSATDSRGNTTAKTVTKDMVNYVRLSCNLGDGMPDGEGTFALEVTGACFYGSFGAVDNTLAVEYRYRVQGEETWEEWTAVDSVLPLGFTYLARARVEGLDYQATYQFQARATDKLETVTTPEKTVKSLPTFDWSGKDFNFNVPVTVQGYSLLGMVKALSTQYQLDTTVTKGTNYTSVTGYAQLMGNSVRCNILATRSSNTGTGNIGNETVCSFTIRHGGKIKNFDSVSFVTGASGGGGFFQMEGTANSGTTATFKVTLAAAASTLNTFNAYFVIPVTLDFSKF